VATECDDCGSNTCIKKRGRNIGDDVACDDRGPVGAD
jgi:hypothetical protein